MNEQESSNVLTRDLTIEVRGQYYFQPQRGVGCFTASELRQMAEELDAMNGISAHPPCKGKNCGSTDPRFHSADCFEEYERTIAGCARETADATSTLADEIKKTVERIAAEPSDPLQAVLDRADDPQYSNESLGAMLRAYKNEIRVTALRNAEPSEAPSREGFQKWAKTQGYYNFRLSDEPTRTYHHDLTEHAWRGWANSRPIRSSRSSLMVTSKLRNIASTCLAMSPTPEAMREALERIVNDDAPKDVP